MMKYITKEVITTMTKEFKVPEDTGECNNIACKGCAYEGDYKTYSDCPHRTVMDYLERVEDDE